VQSRTAAVDTHGTKKQSSASKDRDSGPGDGTMLSVHTTYPLCGWVQHKASKYGTKPVGGLSIGVEGRGADLTFLEMQGKLHSPGVTSCGRMCPRPGKAGWCEDTSLRPVPRCSVG
jgi:hypothetical protein